MFSDRKPWESKHAHSTDKELAELYERAVERNDWSALTELQRPFVEGEPPAGVTYREQRDFRDRR
jgi:hypothetical protein